MMSHDERIAELRKRAEMCCKSFTPIPQQWCNDCFLLQRIDDLSSANEYLRKTQILMLERQVDDLLSRLTSAEVVVEAAEIGFAGYVDGGPTFSEWQSNMKATIAAHRKEPTE